MIKTSPIALATITSIFAFSGVAFADESALPAGTPPPIIRPSIINIKEKRADLRESAKEVRNTFKEGRQDLRIETKEKMKEATSSSGRREIRKDAKEERKGLIEIRKEGIKDVRDQRKELAREHVGKIEQRYSVAIRQFENLAARIQSRIDKIKSAGGDTSQAESALALALTAIAQVKTDAQALADLSAQVKATSEATALRAQIEAAVKKVDASIKLAHNALDKAGKALAVAEKTVRKRMPTGTSTSNTAN